MSDATNAHAVTAESTQVYMAKCTCGHQQCLRDLVQPLDPSSHEGFDVSK